jgi:hypothetical protein
MHAGVPKFVDRQVVHGPLGGMSPPALPASNEPLCDKFEVNIPPKYQDNIGAEDLAGGWSYSPADGEELAGIKHRCRRLYVEERRKEIAATSMRGACHVYRGSKIKV